MIIRTKFTLTRQGVTQNEANFIGRWARWLSFALWRLALRGTISTMAKRHRFLVFNKGGTVIARVQGNASPQDDNFIVIPNAKRPPVNLKPTERESFGFDLNKGLIRPKTADASK